MKPGDRLGSYEVVSLLGAGGMGEVYRARDSKLGREVAIKLLPDLFAQDPDRLARFEREARTLAALNHPNIAHLYGVEETTGGRALVMELVEGDDLSVLIARGSAGHAGIPLAEALPIARQIAEALEAAHEQGVIHRDLKPANVKVRADGVVKVLDFCLAKALDANASGATAEAANSPTLTARATHLGMILGTAAYMSPEQAKGKAVDRRADVWAFGAVLYEMLTGERAFKGEDISDTLAAVLRQDIPLAALPATTPPRLIRLIGRCLDRDPKQRLRDIGEARIAIADAERELALGPAAAGTEVAQVQGRPRPRLWTAIALTGTLALGGIGGVVVSYLRHIPVEPRAIRLQLTPPEGGQFVFGNNVGGIALSPDGRIAAYIASVNGTTSLWVSPLDGSPARLLPGTEGLYGYPFWSPDSRSIAFFKSRQLQRVEIAGGAPLMICTVDSGRGGAWTSDHRILFGSLSAGLFEVPEQGGTPSSLTNLDTSRGENSHRWPQVLPGGRFLYWVQGNPDVQGIYAASLANPTEGKRLVLAAANGLYAPGGDGRGYLLWLRGGTLVAQELDLAAPTLTGEIHQIADPVTSVGLTGQMNVAMSPDGLLLYSAFNTRGQFTWIDRAAPERRPVRVIGEPGEYGVFGLSPDGSRIAASRDRPGGTDIWLLEADRGVPTPLTVASNISNYPVWSPDGKTVLFSSAAPRNLFAKHSLGVSPEQRLTRSPSNQFATDWSRDGAWVLFFDIGSDTKRDLWVLPMAPEGTAATDAKARPYLLTPYNESAGRFSPEPSPHWVAYHSDKSGQTEVYIDSFPRPRGEKMISIGGGLHPQWGADARELFYVSPDFKLMVVKLKLTADSVEPSPPQELFPLPAVNTGLCPYDTSRDGKRFLVRATPEHGTSQPLTVIVNWPALLKDVK